MLGSLRRTCEVIGNVANISQILLLHKNFHNLNFLLRVEHFLLPDISEDFKSLAHKINLEVFIWK